MTLATLSRLHPGSHFRLHGMPEVSGVLLECTDCSAKVRLDGRLVIVTRGNRQFVANTGRVTSWAPATLVEFLWLEGQ